MSLRSTATAVANVSKISGFLSKLFNNSARVNIGLIGDSTVEFGGYGWDHGQSKALLDLGCVRYGTGLHGVNEGDGVAGNGNGVGYGSNMITVGGGNSGTSAGLPVEWRNFATNRSTDNNYLGALQPWWLPSGATAAYSSTQAFGLQLHGNVLKGFSRPFEGLTSDLRFSMWYARTNASFANGLSGTCSTRLRKDADAVQYQSFWIENIGTTNDAGANGMTFGIQFSGYGAAGVTLSNNTTTLISRIQSAVRTASTDSTATVDASGTTGAGGVNANIKFNSSFSDTLPLLTLSTGSLTAAYDNGGAYGTGITTYRALMHANTGFYSVLSTAAGITATQSFTVSETQMPTDYLARQDTFLGASATRDYPVLFSTLTPGVTAYGPWMSFFAAAAISGATYGFANTTIVQIGGRGATTHAGRIYNQTNDFLAIMLQSLAEHAGYTSPGSAPLLIRICGGTNDISDTGVSIGSAATANNTTAGLVDNWTVLINKIEGVYDAYGWSKNNLYWLITPSTPKTSSDSDLQFARNASVQISNSRDRVAAVNMYTLQGDFNTDTTRLANYSDADFYDYAHLSVNGFRTWSYYEWSSIQAAYNAYVANPGASSPASTNGVWFAGKVYTPSQYQKIIETFYPNLLR